MGRVLVDCTHVFGHPDDNSGIQRVVRNVAAELPGLRGEVDGRAVVFRDGRLFEAISLAPGSLERRIRAAADFGLAAQRLADRLASWRLRPLEARQGDQVLLLDSSWHGDTAQAAHALKRRGVGLVAVIHDLVPLTHPQLCVPGLVEDFGRWFDWVSKAADGFLAISETVMKDLEPRIRRLRSDPVWFDYCHHGSRLDLAGRGEIDPRLASAFEGGDAVYLVVGTLEPRKNHAYALDAFERIWRAGSPARLVLIGKKGWKVEGLTGRIENHEALGRRLFLFDRLNDAGLAYAYRHARALLYPSLSEGFGLPMVEAMQHGLPVMASDIPVFHETGDGFAAYFDLRDPGSLADLVLGLEATGRFPAERPLAEWQARDWRTAAHEMLRKVAAHPPPLGATAAAKADERDLSPFDKALRSADRLRDAREWGQAAKAYRAVLDLDPTPAGIWVQLGHALKESGRAVEALEVYRHAHQLDPGDADIERQIGHALSRLGDRDKAAEHYLAALALDPALTDIGDELGDLAKRPRIPGLDISPLGTPAEGPGRRYFDLSDAVDYFGRSSRPTGIQRVQLELARALLHSGQDNRPCAYSARRRGWVELPGPLVKSMYDAATRGGAAEIKSIAGKLAFYLNQAPLLAFPDRAALINLGASWSAAGYMEDLRAIRRERRIGYAPLVFDLIPIKAPQFCDQGAVGQFVRWLSQALEAADAFVAISENTKADLLAFAAFQGRPLDPSRVVVAALNARFDVPAGGRGEDPIQRLGPSGPYVLMVGTLEPRKNHVTVFEAWKRLGTRLGERTPRLVCAGKWGWETDAIREARDGVGDLVEVVSGLSDQELAELYAHALFTVYPSLYEGWGLPVTESLCYGKATLCADNSSLPEAGGVFADYFQASDVDALVERAEQLIADDAYRARREQDIAAGFKPRTWSDIAADVLAAADLTIGGPP